MPIDGFPPGFIEFLQQREVSQENQDAIFADRLAPVAISAAQQDAALLGPWLTDVFTRAGRSADAAKVLPVLQAYFAERAGAGGPFDTRESGERSGDAGDGMQTPSAGAADTSAEGVPGAVAGTPFEINPGAPTQVPGVPELSGRFRPGFIDPDGTVHTDEHLAEIEEQIAELDEESLERLLQDLAELRPDLFRNANSSAPMHRQSPHVAELLKRVGLSMQVVAEEAATVKRLIDGYPAALKAAQAARADLKPDAYYQTTLSPALRALSSALRAALEDFRAVDRPEKTIAQEGDVATEWFFYVEERARFAALGGLDPASGSLMDDLRKGYAPPPKRFFGRSGERS